MRGLVLLAAMLAAAAPVAAQDLSVDSPRWTREYDPLFQKYAKRYFGPHFDWRWFKAQAIVESALQPNVVSPAGAVGLMQILPSTFEDIRRRNPHYVDVLTPRWNIAAGIYYNYYLYRQPAWQGLADEERLHMALAGYNAGLGGALRAFRRTPPPADNWDRIAPQAPAETRAYVYRIRYIRTGEERSRNPRERGIARAYQQRAHSLP
jgi:soluble lytic murein transglycosylase-like protein